ncbi:MAG: hypothetical protein ACLPUO_15435 [Streptosporangiaceae bacterium]
MMVSESAVDFVRLDLDDLDDVAVVAQSLDNQWVRPNLLAKMMKSGLSLTSDKVARERSRQVRAEYIRSLVNSPQVVINRAYIINNPVVRRDFLKGAPGRAVFRDFLQTGTNVPFLWKEESPVQQPGFSVNEQGWEAWAQVAAECRMRCLRLG